MSVDAKAGYKCPACVRTGSIESSDSTDDSWWDCRVCGGTGRVVDRRRSRDPLVEAARVARAALKRWATPDDREAAIRALDAALGRTDPCVAGPQGCDVRPADEMVRCSVCGELVCDFHGEYVSDEAYVRGDFRCPDHLDAALGERER